MNIVSGDYPFPVIGGGMDSGGGCLGDTDGPPSRGEMEMPLAVGETQMPPGFGEMGMGVVPVGASARPRSHGRCRGRHPHPPGFGDTRASGHG